MGRKMPPGKRQGGGVFATRRTPPRHGGWKAATGAAESRRPGPAESRQPEPVETGGVTAAETGGATRAGAGAHRRADPRMVQLTK